MNNDIIIISQSQNFGPYRATQKQNITLRYITLSCIMIQYNVIRLDVRLD